MQLKTLETLTINQIEARTLGGLNTIQCSADTLITVAGNIQCSADTLIAIAETPTTLDLVVNAPIDIPVSVGMDISPALKQIDLAINVLTQLPVSIGLAIESTLQINPIALLVKAPMKLRSLFNMLILKHVPGYQGSTSAYRYKEIPNQYTFGEVGNPYFAKEIVNQYTWKGVEQMYLYTLGERKPVQVEWARKDNKPFTITSAAYSFENIVDDPMSINGKTTLINLEPATVGTNYCKIEVELTPTDSSLPIEKHIAEIQVVVKAPKVA